MLARINGLGDIGIVSDIPPTNIPDNALSSGSNIRAYHGRLTNFPGYEQYASAPIQIYGVFGFNTGTSGALLWLEAGLNEVYVFDGSTHTNITRTSGGNYTMNEYLDKWTGGVQNGLGFLCNGKDSPQQWDQVSSAVPLKDMMYDPDAAGGNQTWGEKNYLAFGMRAYSGTIFAFNLNRGASALPSTVQWCDFIQPGTTEPDWEPKSTNSAGERYIGDTLGAVIDGAPFRDDFIFYKEDSVYRCSFTGDANDPFVFQRLPAFARIIGRNCVDTAAENHIVAADEDVYLFDGNTFTSILTHRYRDFYRSNLWPDRRLTTWVRSKPDDKEVWIGLTNSSNTGDPDQYPNVGIVWNWHDNTLSHTDLPIVRSMSTGVLAQATTPDNYETPPDLAYDDDTLSFDQIIASNSTTSFVGATQTVLNDFGKVETEDANPKTCQAERTGLILQDTKHGIRSADGVNRIVSLKPYLETNKPVEFSVGGQFAMGGPIYWSAWKFFDPQTQSVIRFRQAGRFSAWRIRSMDNTKWSMAGMEIEYKRVRDR